MRESRDWFGWLIVVALCVATACVVLLVVDARLDALESRAAWFRPEAVKETTDGK